MKALQSTIIHTLELIVCVVVAFAIMRLFNVTGEMQATILSLVLAALAKYARTSETSPINDYVNTK